MARDKKLDLINATYELLKVMSPQKVTVRAIADKAGCTNPVIYYHFENLDELILLASVRFYEEYLETLQGMLVADMDIMDVHLRSWRTFGELAFKHVEVFNEMFWGKYRSKLGEAIVEYYQLFPERWPEFSGNFSPYSFVSDVEERTYLMMQMAAAAGYFPKDNLRVFAEVQCKAFHGMLMEYVDEYWDPAKAQEGLERAMHMIEFVNDIYRLK